MIGRVAERLGKGLQNPLLRFNSGHDLNFTFFNNNGILTEINNNSSMPIFIRTNKKRTWTENELREAAKNSTSVRQVLKKLRLKEAGGNYAQIKKYIEFYKINKKHFTGPGWSKGLRGIGKPLIKLEDILVEKSYFQSFKLKKRLFEAKLKPMYCEECGWCEKSKDGRLPLELDHINGNSMDNRLNNLRVLCPNCHSLKPTHRGRNRKKKKVQ